MRSSAVLWSLLLVSCCAKGPPVPTRQSALASVALSGSATPAPSAPFRAVERKDHPFLTWAASVLAGKSNDKPYLQKESKEELGTFRAYKVEKSKEGLLISSGKDPSNWAISLPRDVFSIEEITATSGTKLICESKSKPGQNWHQVESGAFKDAYVVNVDNDHIWLLPEVFARKNLIQMGCMGVKWCKEGKTRTKFKIEPSIFMVACRDLVKTKLLSPKSADFQGVLDGLEEPQMQGDCSYKWDSWVDASNAFGVAIRRHFSCAWNPSTDIVTVELKPLLMGSHEGGRLSLLGDMRHGRIHRPCSTRWAYSVAL